MLARQLGGEGGLFTVVVKCDTSVKTLCVHKASRCAVLTQPIHKTELFA